MSFSYKEGIAMVRAHVKLSLLRNITLCVFSVPYPNMGNNTFLNLFNKVI